MITHKLQSRGMYHGNKLLFVLLIWLTIVSGKTYSQTTKLVNYPNFSIVIPKAWKVLKVEPEDSFYGHIQIDKSTFITFDLGWYSSKLNEDDFGEYYRIEDRKVYSIYYSETAKEPKQQYVGPEDSVTLEKVRRNKIEWIMVDQRKAKLVTPKRTGLGTTGIYIDDLWGASGDSHKAGFQINGSNLTHVQQQQLLTAIKTLKFYQHPDKQKKGNDE